MKNFICNTCGVQVANSAAAPKNCSICTEERQYVSSKGQTWTTLEEMIQSGTYSNVISREEKGLFSIATSPVSALAKRLIWFKERTSIYCGIV